MGEPLQVTDDTFEKEVLQAEKPVVVDFYADWCGPCRAMAPIIDELASEQADTLKVCKVDVTQNMQTASRYGIMSIPTLMFFRNGEVVDKSVGALSKEQLLRKVQQAFG